MFDKDGDGIECMEFLNGLRDPMNERRLKMVKRAFKIMDRDGSGIIIANEIKHLYNASKHPEVIKGIKTEKEVRDEFLNGFDGTEGNNDGNVTWDEFKN